METKQNFFTDEYGVTYSPDRTTLLKGNPQLERYSVPLGTKTIGKHAWCGMDRLKSIHLHDGLDAIEAFAFSGCSRLSFVEIPQTVTSLGADAFASTAIHSIFLPKNLKEICENTFRDCASLRFVSVPALEKIGDHAFARCQYLQVYVGSKKDYLKSISSSAFQDASFSLLVMQSRRDTYLELYPFLRDSLVIMKKERRNPITCLFNADGDYIGDFRFHIS